MPTKGRVSSGAGRLSRPPISKTEPPSSKYFRDLSPGEKNPQAPPKGVSWFVWTVTWTLMFTGKAARLPSRVNFLGKTSDLSAKWTTDILLCSASNSISGSTTIPLPITIPLGGTIVPGIHGGGGDGGIPTAGGLVSATNITTTTPKPIG